MHLKTVETFVSKFQIVVDMSRNPLGPDLCLLFERCLLRDMYMYFYESNQVSQIYSNFNLILMQATPWDSLQTQTNSHQSCLSFLYFESPTVCM